MRKLMMWCCVMGAIGCGSAQDDVGGVAPTPSVAPNVATAGAPAPKLVKRVLARNVVLRTLDALVPSAAAGEGDIDTQTKVLAENVVLDASALGVAATDVQQAFAETAPVVASLLKGAWSVTSGIGYLQKPDAAPEHYTLHFADDGTLTQDGTARVGDPFYGAFRLGHPDAIYTFSVRDQILLTIAVKGTVKSPCSSSVCDQNQGHADAASFDFVILRASPTHIVLQNAGGVVMLSRGS